jgi:ATP-grasp domain
MTSRKAVIARIEADLGTRDLVWFGTRGDDADGVADVANLASSFSIIAQYRSRATVAGYALERHSGLRVDLDVHDIDEDPFVAPIGKLRRELLDALATPSVIFTYRPSTFLSAVCFARQGRATYLGMFKDHQAAFEHKPWVESAIGGLKLPRIPWRYVADSEQSAVLAMFRTGPIVLRRSHSSGGTGVVLVNDPHELAQAWPTQDEAFVSVAPFIPDALPVNVGAVVWDDGVTVDLPSMQLIGLSELTPRQFGYCGNDFAAAKTFSDDLLDAIEENTALIGRWMGDLGYRGAFGVDYLVQNDVPLFVEVNPRFQGSTHASSRLARVMGESCIMTDHLSALLHHGPGPRRPLARRVRDCPDLSHIVVHTTESPVGPVDSHGLARRMSSAMGYAHADVIHPPELDCALGAAIGRFTFRRSVTSTGFDLAPDLKELVAKQSSHDAAWQETV